MIIRVESGEVPDTAHKTTIDGREYVMVQLGSAAVQPGGPGAGNAVHLQIMGPQEAKKLADIILKVV